MPFELDTSAWTGEGTFTQVVIDRLREVEAIRLVRVENAPATRSDADYNFISNEVYVAFATVDRQERIKRFGVLPASRTVSEKTMTLSGLEAALAGIAEIEVRQGIGRVLLKAGFKSRARLLVLVLFQELVPRGEFLGPFIKEGRRHRLIGIEREYRDEYKDLPHSPPPHWVEETITPYPHIV